MENQTLEQRTEKISPERRNKISRAARIMNQMQELNDSIRPYEKVRRRNFTEFLKYQIPTAIGFGCAGGAAVLANYGHNNNFPILETLGYLANCALLLGSGGYGLAILVGSISGEPKWYYEYKDKYKLLKGELKESQKELGINLKKYLYGRK